MLNIRGNLNFFLSTLPSLRGEYRERKNFQSALLSWNWPVQNSGLVNKQPKKGIRNRDKKNFMQKNA